MTKKKEEPTNATTPEVESPFAPDDIYDALFAVQHEIGILGKNAANPHFRSRFADLPGIWSAIAPAFHRAGIVIYGGFPEGSDVSHGTVAVSMTLRHVASGTELREQVTMPIAKLDAQGTGSALTYARRYILSHMAFLVTADDPSATIADDDGEAAVGRGEDRETPSASRPAAAKNETDDVRHDAVALATDILARVDGDVAAARTLLKEITANGEKFAGFVSVEAMKHSWQIKQARERLAAHPVFGDPEPTGGA